jgi:dTDP-4-amino-4,6-dideoxygalactose transaminase
MLLINHLGARVARYQQEIESAISQVLSSGWMVLGPSVTRFEAQFADYIGTPYCISVANGTDAIELALRALGVNAGARVATVANAGMYTSTTVLAIGALPVFMDVEESTACVSFSEVERALASGVQAVVVTHLYGRAVPEIAKIAEACRAKGVPLLEDCAQSHGALLAGRRVGTFGDAASFSFYPTKNLGGLGDGGAVTTAELQVAEKLRHLRQYGWTKKYNVEIRGGRNSRLDELQAAVLSVFLPDLDASNERRRQIAGRYHASIRHPDVLLPPVGREDYVAHLYVLRCSRREALAAHLKQCQIASDVHYPVPDHRQLVFADQFASVKLPVTESLAERIITIPCYPEMTDEEIDRVVSAINTWPQHASAQKMGG